MAQLFAGGVGLPVRRDEPARQAGLATLAPPMPTRKRSISVVLPAYDEEACLERCVKSLEGVLAEIADDYEIVVVDDGSRDATPRILAELARSRPWLHVERHERNRGLGATLRTGFLACTKDLTFYSDADLPFDFHELRKALRVMELKEADLVTGFRHDRTSEGLLRILYSFTYNWLIRVLFGVRIKDINFSFKLVRTDVLRRLDLRSEGSFIDAEMMVKASRGGLTICQIGIDYLGRHEGRSHLSSPATILGILKELVGQFRSLRAIRPEAR